MATFVTLVNFTDQGIRNVKDSPDRFEAFRAMAEQFDVKVRSAHYTCGRHDMVIVVEGPEEAAMTSLLKVGSLGFVRTEALRAYSVEEMRKFVAAMP